MRVNPKFRFRHKVRLQPAMPIADLPAFIAKLRGNSNTSARMLEFIILTAARASEVLKARRSEIDFDARVWTVPLDHSKNGKRMDHPHCVPLSRRAIEILEETFASCDSEYLFHKARSGSLGSSILGALIPEYTVHGFRRTFKDWARKHRHLWDDELCELALSHEVGSELRKAYGPDRLCEERRPMIDAWATFCGGGTVSGC
jgi:integrase